MAQIWGDPSVAASLFETRVCFHIADRTPSDWIVIVGSNQSYTGKDTLDIDLLLFTPKNCFVIEVKGGNITRITDEKWMIGYHGNPPQENRLFKKMLRSRNILHGKLKIRNYALNRLPVVPVICCYDEVIVDENLRADLRALDEGNRKMTIGFKQLLYEIEVYERASKFKSTLTPIEIAGTVYSRYEFKVPKISFANLDIFRRVHEFNEKGAGKEYADLVYQELGPYFQYITVKIAEATQGKISKIHGEAIDLYPYLIEKSKLYGRSFAFFPFVRYPDVDYVDYAQLAFNLGYFDEKLVKIFDVKGILSPPTYGITVKASVYKAHRQDRLTAQENFEKDFKYFLSKLKQLGPQYGFLHHETEKRNSISFWKAKDLEPDWVSFVKNDLNKDSIAVGFEGFFTLKKEWVENSEDLIGFVSDEFCKLYPLYKYLFEELL